MIKKLEYNYLISASGAQTIANPEALYAKINEIIEYINEMEK